MIDLETMGKAVNSAFVSLGAVVFEKHGDSVAVTEDRTFYRNVDLQSCLDLGMEIDGSTVYWWLRQSDGARKAICVQPQPITQVLSDFAVWYKRWCHDRYKDDVWSHGATFDIPMVAEAYHKAGMKLPWEFYRGKDTRTVFDDADMKLPRADFRPGGHNALFDAVAQAQHLQRCYAFLRGDGTPVAAEGASDEEVHSLAEKQAEGPIEELTDWTE